MVVGVPRPVVLCGGWKGVVCRGLCYNDDGNKRGTSFLLKDDIERGCLWWWWRWRRFAILWTRRRLLLLLRARSEAVHLQLLRLGQPGLGQPLANVLALVALQLQHLAVLCVLHYRSVARKLLFTCPDDLLQVILGGEALHRG